MARVLLILSIILTLICAGLGFVAKKNVDTLSDAVKEKSSQLIQARNTTKKAQDDLGAATKELAVSKQQLEEKTAEAATQKTAADEASKKLTEASASLEAKVAEMAALKKQFDTAGTPVENVGDRIKEMQDKLTKAETELGELKVMNDTLTQRAKDKEDALVAAENTVKAYKYGAVKNGLSGRVLAYNPGWNFVVLSIGDKSGLKAGANMIVQRGNTMVAKVKVSTVEPNTAIADVLPGSMRGGKVEPGDTVIFEGTR